MGWDGMGWDGLGWHGIEQDGLGWNGMAWDGMGCLGLGWGGLGWDGPGLPCPRGHHSPYLLCLLQEYPVLQLQPQSNVLYIYTSAPAILPVQEP